MNKNILFLTLMIISMAISAQKPKPLTITPNTHFVQIPGDIYWVSDLEDGAWTVKNDDGYAFYLDDGRKLFDFEWTCQGNRDPQMLGGAVVMSKKTGPYPRPQYILYRDGGIKELPAEWSGPATNFVDGVALIGTGKSYIYINVNGQRVYGNLVSVPERFEGKGHTVPPLREGLRAYRSVNSSGYGDKWGFIDEKGNIVIPARFDQCHSFSEGYSLVKEGKSIYFIDKKGNKAISLDNIEADDLMWGDVSDVKDGLFLVSNEGRTYYNTKAEKQFNAGGATSFYEGYAFCENKKNFDLNCVIDRGFNVVGYTPNVMSSWNGTDNPTPIFSPVGVATAEHNRVLAPDGTILIQHWPASPKRKLANNYGIHDFSASGYAQAWLDNFRDRYHGFINLDGEFVIIYDWNRNLASFVRDQNNPQPCKNPPCNFRDPEPDTPCTVCDSFPIQPIPVEPIGPTNVTRHEYTVTVTAQPAQGGTVSGGGKYLLGADVKLGATPNKDWKLVKWECTTPGYFNSKLPAGVHIGGRDLSFVAHFKKLPDKDTIDNIGNTGCYCAHQSGVQYEAANVEFDVYMQMSSANDISTPYGEQTSGFLTCVMDPNTPVTYEEINGKTIGMSYKMFFVPMKIAGIINEKDGKRYLVLDGGQFMVSDIEFTGADDLTLMYLNSIMKSEGTIGTLSTGRYRLELLDYDESNGECTFGELYRFHPDNGWMVADEYPATTTNTYYGSKTVANAITGTLFKGLRMKVCSKREVEFTPPQGWVKEGYDDFVAKLTQQMRTLMTDWDKFFSGR